MGSDNITTATAAANNAFQSTLPGWGATGRILGHGFPVGISIHAPRMGSDPPADMAYITQSISIHAPRMGSDSNVPMT